MKTWILVADAHRAEVWASNPRQELRLVEEIVPEHAHRFARETDHGKPGRAFSTADGRHSAIEPHNDPLANEQHLFVRRLIAGLKSRIADGDFDRLAVIASPKMLGDIRKEIAHHQEIQLVVDQSADLMKLPPEKVRAHIQALIGPQ